MKLSFRVQMANKVTLPATGYFCREARISKYRVYWAYYFITLSPTNNPKPGPDPNIAFSVSFFKCIPFESDKQKVFSLQTIPYHQNISGKNAY